MDIPVGQSHIAKPGQGTLDFVDRLAVHGAPKHAYISTVRCDVCSGCTKVHTPINRKRCHDQFVGRFDKGVHSSTI